MHWALEFVSVPGGNGSGMQFPWQGQPFDKTLTALRSGLLDLAAHKPSGVLLPALLEVRSEKEIDEREKVIGRRIPDPLRHLYRTVDGLRWPVGRIHPGATFLHALDEADWLDPDLEEEFMDIPPQWRGNDYFAFAQSIVGDTIAYCGSPPRGPCGSVILLDHECSNRVMAEWKPRTYFPIVFLADSFGDWLARWIRFGFDEPARGCRDDHPADLERQYLLDHLRLNPGLEWVQERLRHLGNLP